MLASCFPEAIVRLISLESRDHMTPFYRYTDANFFRDLLRFVMD